MERRDFEKTGLAGAAVGLMSASMASAQDQSHAHHTGKKLVVPVASDELKKVAETAYDCERTATACIAECNLVLATARLPWPSARRLY